MTTPFTVADVTGFTRDLLAGAIKSALEPMIGEPITTDNIEAVKATVAQKLGEFYSANDVAFPLRINTKAGAVRELLGKPTHVPDQAVLFLMSHRVIADTDLATRSLKVAMQYDGEWRLGNLRWQAADTETALGIALESSP